MVACYLPPNDSVGRAKEAMEYIAAAVGEAKRKYDDPYVVVAGDFNQWRVADALVSFPDVVEHSVGPTRAGKELDKIFSNIVVSNAGNLPCWKQTKNAKRQLKRATTEWPTLMPRSPWPGPSNG